jgi:hypothetical protein
MIGGRLDTAAAGPVPGLFIAHLTELVMARLVRIDGNNLWRHWPLSVMAGEGPPSMPGGAETGIRRGRWPSGHHDGIEAEGPIPLKSASMWTSQAMTIPVTLEPLSSG